MLRLAALILIVSAVCALPLCADNMILMPEKEWDILKAQFLQAVSANDYPVIQSALEKMKDADRGEAVEALLASYSHFHEKAYAKGIPPQAPKEMLDVLVTIPQVLAVYKSDEAVEKLIEYGLKSKNPERVELAAGVLRVIKPAAAVPVWIDLVESKKTLPGVLIDCLEGLAAVADKTCADALLKLAEKEERLEVQLPLITAFKNLNELRAIPHLIRFLENGSYRVKVAAKDALIALTGKNLRDNISMWKEWWQQNQAAIGDGSFQKTETPATEETPSTVVDFYGVKIETDRILFVLDMSDSMKTTYPGTKKSKGDVAKEELTKAIKGLPEDAYFNIVFFNAGVFVFSKNKMAKADAKTVQDAVKFVEEFNFAWGTNVYGAMEKAFELAGVLKNGKPVVSTGGGASYVDTIFFLSDGLPVGGEVEDPNQILAAIRDWNRNIRITVNTIYIQVAGASKEKQKFGLTGYQFLERMAKENQGAYNEK